MTNNPTIDGVSLKRDDKLFHRGNGRNCDRGWVEYICDEGCGDVRVRHQNGAVPAVKLSDLQWHAMTDEQQLDEFYSELSNGGKLSKRALCHIRDQQSTIAQLQARIAELESGRGEPVAWEMDDTAGESGLIQVTNDPTVRDEWVRDELPICPLFAAPPAPVAVVPDERAAFESNYKPEALERDGDEYVRMPVQMAWEGWQARACLDATAALNEVKK